MSSPPLFAVLVPGLSDQYNDADGMLAYIPSRGLFSVLCSYLAIEAVVPEVYPYDQDSIIRALMRADMELPASAFNDWLLSVEILDRIKTAAQWIIIGHSAGGILIYNWIARHAKDFPNPPMALYVFDAAHTISDDTTPILPGIASGGRRKFPIRGQRPVLLVDRPGLVSNAKTCDLSLRIYSAGKDTFLDNDTIFLPSELNDCRMTQVVLSGAGHNGICSCDETIREILADLRTRPAIPSPGQGVSS